MIMDFRLIEDKWQKYWEEHPEIYEAGSEGKDKRDKKYVLVEFPYPSGSGLHIGHAFSFTGGDIQARFWRMRGKKVLFPMGWDAFGLPTENYAIRTKKKPQAVTAENTQRFKEQMKKLAYSFDWSREIDTTDPAYYKWTQWIFIQLFKKGLAEKREMPINWCPSCKIGLANEEVVDGKCERCGAEVSRRTISQWVVKITKYADKLIEGLKETDFIDKVKQSQINWIGKSEGAKVRFKIQDLGFKNKILEVFTTRPDTLFGVTFMVIAPEHALVESLSSSSSLSSEKKKEIETYVKNSRAKSDLERTELNKKKTGVFSGLEAINPVNNKKIPVWISDFVLASYGTGAIMSVPAHDQRDFEFAKKFGLEVAPVMETKGKWDFNKEAYMGEGKMINSPMIEGLESKEAIEKMIRWLEDEGIGERAASYHLRDWIFSRQHYWGEPIPMIYCPKCAHQNGGQGWVPVAEKDLPVVLPEVDHYEPTDDGKSPLSQMSHWVETECPKCGSKAQRETDTMPNWAGSDWYFLRYVDPKNEKQLVDKNKWRYWGPVDIYIGGDEHNVLHLLYSRFIYLFLRDMGAVVEEISEPYFRRISHGVILGPDGQRMSKSRGNVVVPETVAEKYGVDVARMYLMFMGPFDATMAWNEKTLMGVKRFLERMDKFIRCQTNNDSVSNKEAKVIINKLIAGVTGDLENFKYNTAIAKMMQAINEVSDVRCQMSEREIKTLIKLMAPVAPYVAEEWWSLVGGKGSVHRAAWPEAEVKYLVDEETVVAVAVNGKVRSEIKIETKEVSNKNKIIDLAKKDKRIKKWLSGGRIVKEIYVPGKMINFVVVS